MSQSFYLLSRELDTLTSIMGKWGRTFMIATPEEQVEAMGMVLERCQSVLANVAHLHHEMKVYKVITVHQRTDQIMRSIRYWVGCLKAVHSHN